MTTRRSSTSWIGAAPTHWAPPRGQAEADVRVIVLRGAGERAFIGGADIRAMVDLTPESSRVHHLDSQRRRNPPTPVPVVARTSGYCLEDSKSRLLRSRRGARAHRGHDLCGRSYTAIRLQKANSTRRSRALGMICAAGPAAIRRRFCATGKSRRRERSSAASTALRRGLRAASPASGCGPSSSASAELASAARRPDHDSKDRAVP